ncbi:CPBP family intramembrane glutamic endopeptidase [Peribacillus alkalitolerans]|uniref:CPBP family intramembrane glutamic endopeptidase n=1 Tax=Peribacillus alkalitolerans TaxID=1550385 RepID=UPI0013D19A56|nr:CPBP family intramembrane glutamic endopeptidase [Peribacillus alkalitolerans]
MKNKQAELIKHLTDKQLLANVLLTQVLVLVVAAIVGFFAFDSFQQFSSLFRWDYGQILIFGGLSGLLIVSIDILFMKILPERYHDDGGINKRIFGSLSYPKIITVAFIVAVAEEVLFRGVLQSTFGLILTSIIFSIVHYRYLFNWFLFINIVLLSFFIGFLFEWTGNLNVTIFAHFLIDCILGIIIRRSASKEMTLEVRED